MLCGRVRKNIETRDLTRILRWNPDGTKEKRDAEWLEDDVVLTTMLY
jgi:hypothetical protein